MAGLGTSGGCVALDTRIGFLDLKNDGVGQFNSRGLSFQDTTFTSMPSLRYLRLSPI